MFRYWDKFSTTPAQYLVSRYIGKAKYFPWERLISRITIFLHFDRVDIEYYDVRATS